MNPPLGSTPAILAPQLSPPLLPCLKPSPPNPPLPPPSPLLDLIALFGGDRPVMSLVEACEPSGG